MNTMDNYEEKALKLLELPDEAFFHLFCRTPLEHFMYMSEIRSRLQKLLLQWELNEAKQPGNFKTQVGGLLASLRDPETHQYKFEWYLPDDEIQIKRMRLILMILLDQTFPREQVGSLLPVALYIWNIIYHAVVDMSPELAYELDSFQPSGREAFRKTTRKVMDMFETFRVY